MINTQFVHIGSREVYPLWALSTVHAGGVDWTTKEIGEVGCLAFLTYSIQAFASVGSLRLPAANVTPAANILLPIVCPAVHMRKLSQSPPAFLRRGKVEAS